MLGDGTPSTLLLPGPTFVVEGDEVWITSPLTGGSLRILGDGSTTHVDDDLDMDGDVTINDAVLVHGDRRIEATGDIVIGLPSGSVNGNGDGTPRSVNMHHSLLGYPRTPDPNG